MSRYFEVLQRTGIYTDLFPANASPPAEPPGPRVVSEELRLGPPPEGRDREEITKLVQQVFLAAEAGAHRAVLFCGVEDSAGSSRICAQAARLLAELGTGTVCLVDVDWRNPSLHRHLRVENRRGLANALVEAGPIREFARPFAGGKLWILPAGNAGTPASAGMSAESLRARLAELRAEFDCVVLAAPPVAHSADALVLGKLTDGVVLVIAANRTRRETTRQVKDSLDAAKVRLLGAVLDERTFPIPEALYRKL